MKGNGDGGNARGRVPGSDGTAGDIAASKPRPRPVPALESGAGRR